MPKFVVFETEQAKSDRSLSRRSLYSKVDGFQKYISAQSHRF